MASIRYDRAASLSQFVRDRRRELGLSQFDLAVRYGCRPAMIYQFEHLAGRTPTLRTLNRLAGSLEVPLEELLRSLGYGERR